MEAMCHTPRERKSKSLDKGSDSVGREKNEEKKKKEKKIRERKEMEKKGKGEKGEVIFLVKISYLREERRRGKDE